VTLIRTADDENVVGLQRVAEPVEDEELDGVATEAGELEAAQAADLPDDAESEDDQPADDEEE
jgi:DNA gyrase subunit A